VGAENYATGRYSWITPPARSRDDLSEHVSLAIIGAPAALAWLTQRLDGGATPQGCTTSTVPSMLLIPAGLSSLPSFLTAIVTAPLDEPIGPGNIF
jgi:hypothetical protein